MSLILPNKYMNIKHSTILITIGFIIFAYFVGYFSGVFGFNAIETAKAKTEQSMKLYTESNALYDKAQKLSCVSYGIILAECYSGNTEACSLKVQAFDSFQGNFGKDPDAVCGL